MNATALIQRLKADEACGRTTTVYNRSRFADALLASGQVDASITHHEQAASDPLARDAPFLSGLAHAQFGGRGH